MYDPAHPFSIAIERLVLKSLALRDELQKWVAQALANFESSHHAWTARAVPPPSTTRFGDRVTFDAPAVKQAPYVRARRHALQDEYLAHGGIADMSVLALVAAFDAFLGEALEAQLQLDVHQLRNSQVNLTVEEVLNTPDHLGLIIDKITWRLLRESRKQQAKSMERYTRYPLDQLPEWPAIEELSDRRNAIAHNGSAVTGSTHRLRKLEPVADGPAVLGLGLPARRGHTVGMTPEQVSAAAENVIVTAVKIAHMMWRSDKRDSDALDQANTDLAQLTYSLLVQEEWNLARRLLEFACEIAMPNGHAEADGLRFIVNLAQAHKWLGDEAACQVHLAKVNWQAKDIPFRLAHAVLQDDYQRAAMLMDKAARNGDMDRSAFDHWPLFRRFRETAQFLSTYEAVFGRPFSPDHGPENDPGHDQESVA